MGEKKLRLGTLLPILRRPREFIIWDISREEGFTTESFVMVGRVSRGTGADVVIVR